MQQITTPATSSVDYPVITSDQESKSNIMNTPSPATSLAYEIRIMVGLKIVVGIIGILGNAMVCVILKRVRSQKVNFLITSQAIIDLVTSIFFVIYAFARDLYPIPLPQHPIRGYLYCLFWQWATIQFWLFGVSTYNLIAISIERYISILHPMWHLANFTRKKTIMLACSCWVIGPLFQFIYSVSQTVYNDGICGWNEFKDVGRIAMGVWLFFWDFFMPCLIMGYCSTRICLVVIAQSRNDKNMKAHLVVKGSTAAKAIADAEARRNRSITITFIVVVVAYFVCWCTNQFSFFYSNVSGSDAFPNIGRAGTYFGRVMAQLNSAINPFIYVLCMKEYREKVRLIFCKKRMDNNISISATTCDSQL